MEKPRQPTRRVVAHEKAGIDAKVPQGSSLMIGVINDAAPKGPGQGDDDADFH